MAPLRFSTRDAGGLWRKLLSRRDTLPVPDQCKSGAMVSERLGNVGSRCAWRVRSDRISPYFPCGSIREMIAETSSPHTTPFDSAARDFDRQVRVPVCSLYSSVGPRVVSSRRERLSGSSMTTEGGPLRRSAEFSHTTRGPWVLAACRKTRWDPGVTEVRQLDLAF